MSTQPLPLAEPAATDLFSKFDPLIAERQALLDTGVRDPFAIVMDEVLSPTLAVIQGKETILLGPAAASSTAPIRAIRNARRR